MDITQPKTKTLLSVDELSRELDISPDKLEQIKQALDTAKLVGRKPQDIDEELLNQTSNVNIVLSKEGLNTVKDYLESCDYGVMSFTLSEIDEKLSEMTYADYVQKVTTTNLQSVIQEMPSDLAGANMVHMCLLNARYTSDEFELNLSNMIDKFAQCKNKSRDDLTHLINELLKMNDKWNGIFYEAMNEQRIKIKHFVLIKAFQMYMMEYNKSILFFTFDV